MIDDYYTTIVKWQTVGMGVKNPSGKLCETERHANPLSIKGKQDNAALAVISHGVEGRGAYPNPLERPALGNDESQNATSDTEIIDRPLSYDPQNPFSHKVVWVTALNLLALYGHAPCPPPPMIGLPVMQDVPQTGNRKFFPENPKDINNK